MEEINPDKIRVKKSPPARPPPPCRLAKDSPLGPRAIVPPRRQPSSPITTKGITSSGKNSPSRVNDKPLSNKNTGVAIHTVPPPMTSTRAESLPSNSAATPSFGTISILDLSPRIIIDNIKETKSNILAKTKPQNSSDGPTTQRSSSLGKLRTVGAYIIPQSISSRPVFTSNSKTHHHPAPTEQTRSREREPTPNKAITNTSLHAETTEASTTTSTHIPYLNKQRSGPRAPPPKPRRKDESLEDPIYAVIKPQNVTSTMSAHDLITPYAVHRQSAIDDGNSESEYVDMNVLKNKDSKQSNNNDDGIDDGIYVYANPRGNKTLTHLAKLNNNSEVTTEDGYTGLKKQLDDDGGGDGEDTQDVSSNTLTESHKTTSLESIPPTQLTKLTTENGYISLKTQLNDDDGGDGYEDDNNGGDGYEDDTYTDIIINSVTDSHEHNTTPLGNIPPTQLTKLTTSEITSSLKTQLNNDGDGEDDMYTDIIINSGTEHKAAAAHQQLQSSKDNEMYVNFTQLKAS